MARPQPYISLFFFSFLLIVSGNSNMNNLWFLFLYCVVKCSVTFFFCHVFMWWTYVSRRWIFINVYDNKQVQLPSLAWHAIKRGYPTTSHYRFCSPTWWIKFNFLPRVLVRPLMGPNPMHPGFHRGQILLPYRRLWLFYSRMFRWRRCPSCHSGWIHSEWRGRTRFLRC
jgi:hypothetical protein